MYRKATDFEYNPVKLKVNNKKYNDIKKLTFVIY